MILLSGTTLSVPMTSLWNINNKDKVHDADNNTVARCARDGGASRHWRSSPQRASGACALVCSALLVTFPTLVRFTTPLYLRLRRTQ
ncbi:Uncharacterised protein [Vibrio cholerae]|uniref:Uncharacterized protein n=1 Tax=Vibrio cholerae TaxID=666 RepID=A0A655RIC4_VIBCL|nr:Uncharacterised protein [Vibrio cholerae]CSA97309.1 Uncharacterised protein [Vibrio cholerae]CSB16981.1 Uncharacterised protein [Vibrio cholerae]CSB77288.1 Uncharacterised protein [Vibrio cholerae]